MRYEAGRLSGAPTFRRRTVTTLGPYDIENLKFDDFRRGLDRPKVAAYRDQERQVRICLREARSMKLPRNAASPLDFRILNGAREGTAHRTGPKYKRIGFLETGEALKTSDHPSKTGGQESRSGCGVGDSVFQRRQPVSSATVKYSSKTAA